MVYRGIYVHAYSTSHICDLPMRGDADVVVLSVLDV